MAKVFKQLRAAKRQRDAISESFRSLIDFDAGNQSLLLKLSIAAGIPSTTFTLLTPTTGLGGFLKIIRAPHPSQFQKVVVVIIGGITFKEYFEVRRSFEEKGVQAVVVSTGISSGKEFMVKVVF